MSAYTLEVIREVSREVAEAKDALFMRFVLDQGLVREYHEYMTRLNAHPHLMEGIVASHKRTIAEADAVMAVEKEAP